LLNFNSYRVYFSLVEKLAERNKLYFTCLAKKSGPSLVAAALEGFGAVAVLAAWQHLALLASLTGPPQTASALAGILAVAALRVAIAATHRCKTHTKPRVNKK